MIRLSTSYYLNLSNYDDDNLLVVVHQPSSILSAFDLHNLHYLEFTNLLKWQVWSSLVGHKSVGPFLLKFSIALVVGGIHRIGYCYSLWNRHGYRTCPFCDRHRYPSWGIYLSMMVPIIITSKIIIIVVFMAFTVIATTPVMPSTKWWYAN